MIQTPLVGSYSKEDCQFLLAQIDAEFLSIEEKETQIQSGFHYSEMLNKESAPSESYMALFYQFVDTYKHKLAKHIMQLASIIDRNRPDEITLVSLARAGTPIGVLLKRALEEHYGRNVSHFSISIVRDRGLDVNALSYLLTTKKINPQSIAFVDGWTAKGVITGELYRSVNSFNKANNTTISPELYVVSDSGGWADYSATSEDYPIPSSMLNATVSGLISRSVWHPPETNQFHGCVKYNHFNEIDCSNWFVNEIVALFPPASSLRDDEVPLTNRADDQVSKQQSMTRFITDVINKHSIADINHIKPGIAEATRVMLRRVPELLIVRSMESEKVQHLVILAKEKNVKISVESTLMFEACALIKQLVK